MNHFTIFHTDLPPEIRREPVKSARAGKLTRLIFERARAQNMPGPFTLEHADDRIIVKQVNPGIPS